MPPDQVEQIVRALPADQVTDARTDEDRRLALPEADILLANRLSEEEAAAARRLRWIQTSAVGVGGVLRPSVVGRDVVVTNARGLHADVIAEHAIALMLALRRGLHVAGARQTARVWAQAELSRRRVARLPDITVLVVGLGEIGSRVARLAAGLGVRVVGVRRRPERPAPPGVTSVVGPERLHDALGDADVVVLALPSTPETRGLFGSEALAAMRPSALLVNVARGRLVDETALAEALRAGTIGGAAVDAFAEEPLPSDSPWWGLPNVLVTPHTAAFDGDYWSPVVRLFVDNVERFRRGQVLLNVVDKARGY